MLNYYSDMIRKEKNKLERIYEDRLNDIITVEEYKKMSEKIKSNAMSLENLKSNLEKRVGVGVPDDPPDKLDKLMQEFMTMENPTKEIIREFIYKIEVHENKEIDIYFNFKPLEDIQRELENEIYCARKPYKRAV